MIIGHKLWCVSSVFSSLMSHIQSTSKSYQFDFWNRSGFRPILDTSTAPTPVQATTSLWIILITSLCRLQWYLQYSCQNDHSTRKSDHVSPFQTLHCLSISLRGKCLRCPKAPTWTGPGLSALVPFGALPYDFSAVGMLVPWTCQTCRCLAVFTHAAFLLPACSSSGRPPHLFHNFHFL